MGALRIPPYFLFTFGFLIQFITILEEMGTNQEPFPKKSCFQNITHRSVELVSSLEYYSFDGILMIYSLTHRVPTQIRHGPVFGGANVASAQAGSKQPHKTTRHYKKDLAEGSRIT